jgi:hypothetical protein
MIRKAYIRQKTQAKVSGNRKLMLVPSSGIWVNIMKECITFLCMIVSECQ